MVDMLYILTKLLLLAVALTASLHTDRQTCTQNNRDAVE